MGLWNDIFGNQDDTNNDTNTETKSDTRDDDAKLLLRQEELDINKSRVQTGEVEFGKEIIEEQKTVDIPLLREEVVIERKTLNNERSDSPIADEETIRIPVSQEIVNVDKHTVVTGEVSAHKRDIEETKHIDETLKREEARIREFGNPDVIDNVSDQPYQ
ncbi:YsnF/AvaK domain-containing protein [Desulfosporosinus fructosivorans]|uniref:YsnF/AvaK domain-containing protein n=1 Tax=Desulfosporosinus fructosivorans TaxID=2018669 RepID=A0A4Z0QYS7_9FIRM|nr:YsnF/AvaK domain-containing protein [Desulfosporosinus fructosivorans]TGE35225.1 YsnF/AvaK domain-containing protein [Desulfosporosinus fructosivorans]